MFPVKLLVFVLVIGFNINESFKLLRFNAAHRQQIPSPISEYKNRIVASTVVHKGVKYDDHFSTTTVSDWLDVLQSLRRGNIQQKTILSKPVYIAKEDMDLKGSPVLDNVSLNREKEIYKVDINNDRLRHRTKKLPIRREVTTLLNEIKELVKLGKDAAALKMLKETSISSEFNELETNFAATKMMSFFSEIGNWRICADTLSLISELRINPDIHSVSAAMSVYIRYQRYEEAVLLYENFNEKGLNKDVIFYINSIRAAGFCRPWNYSLNVLSEAFVLLNTDVIPIVNTIIINLKYIDKMNTQGIAAVDKTQEVFTWMIEKNLDPSPQTMDAILAVTCVHGSPIQIERVLQQMKQLNLKPNEVSFNTLLDRFATDGNVAEAVEVVNAMRDWGYMPDEITYNTLLKLCVRKNDLEGAKEILNTMKTFDITPSGYTKSLLINIYSMNNQTELAIDLIFSEKEEYVTPYMYASAIGACKTNYKQALMLLQKASLNNKADEAVFTITAKILSKQNEYEKAFKVIDAMLLRGLSFNKFSFSFIINALLEYQMSGNDSIHLLQKYLNVVKINNPLLLTNAVCQKVIKDLLLCNQSPVAAMLHLDFFTLNTCKPDTLGELFKDLQVMSMECVGKSDKLKVIKEEDDDIINNLNYDINDLVKSNNDESQIYIQNNVIKDDIFLEDASRLRYFDTTFLRRVLAERGLALVGLYCSSDVKDVSSDSSSSMMSNRYSSFNPTGVGSSFSDLNRVVGNSNINFPRRRLLRIAHFNSVLRLLSLAGMFDHSEELFRLISGTGDLPLKIDRKNKHNDPASILTKKSSERNDNLVDRIDKEKMNNNNELFMMTDFFLSMTDEDNNYESSYDSIYDNNDNGDDNNYDINGNNKNKIQDGTYSNRNTGTDDSIRNYDKNIHSDDRDKWTWRPGIFTIAELIRASREARKPGMTLEVIKWGVKEGVKIPFGVMSDAISFVYREGRRDLALEIYITLYSSGLIQHWSHKSPQNLEIDLHSFSRGMAYAAITCALTEVRKLLIPPYNIINYPQQNPNNNIFNNLNKKISSNISNKSISLTVITGQNIKNRNPTGSLLPKFQDDPIRDILQTFDSGKDDILGDFYGSDYSETSSVKKNIDDEYINEKAYTLTEEVSSVLIEDFYPPISSSTVPGNPGRLLIILSNDDNDGDNGVNVDDNE